MKDSVFPILCSELTKANVSVEQLAEVLNITETVARNKLQGLEPWKLYDAIVICRLLNRSDTDYLFLQ